MMHGEPKTFRALHSRQRASSRSEWTKQNPSEMNAISALCASETILPIGFFRSSTLDDMEKPHGECGAWDDIEAEQETALTMSSMLAGRWAFQKFCVQCGVCRAHRESLHLSQLRGNTKGGMKG
jgi:hypothetical protein